MHNEFGYLQYLIAKVQKIHFRSPIAVNKMYDTTFDELHSVNNCFDSSETTTFSSYWRL